MRKVITGIFIGILVAATSATAAVKTTRYLHRNDWVKYAGISCKAAANGAIICLSHSGFGYAVALSNKAVAVNDGSGHSVFSDLNP